MKYLLTLITLLALAGTSYAQDNVLPFGVNLGDQAAAMTEDSSIVSKIANPVAAGAVMSVKDVTGQIIVNIFPANDKGEVASGAQAMILLFDASASKAISANMQGQTPKAGWYVANVVGGGKTSRVLFQVK